MAECIMPVVSLFEVYDSGKDIGVLFREWAYGYHRYPIAFQGSIEATYSLARSTCEVLSAFYNADRKFPKCLDQFIEGLSQDTQTLEEYLTDLRLFLQYGGCETCSQCRFLQENGKCKVKLPGCIAQPDDRACCIGIRKEQE